MRRYKCGSCNATYYGKTKRHLKVRTCEHLGISRLTEKKVKIDKNKLKVIQEYLLFNYSPSFEDLSILNRESKDFKLKLMEPLLIARDKPILNKEYSSLLLELFNLTLVVTIWFFIPSYDVHLYPCAYTIVACSFFIIMLPVFYFIKNRM